jgi:hypothetical protein
VDPRTNADMLSSRGRKQLHKSGREPFRVERVFWDAQGSMLDSREKQGGEHAGEATGFSGVTENRAAIITAASSPPCPFLVGLHPDEATEAIVDAALWRCLPFAVVPCCVYARLSPHSTISRAARSHPSTVLPISPR